MSKGTEKSSFFEKLATVIVDKRNLIFFLYACALIFCLFSRNWVSVCNDITESVSYTHLDVYKRQVFTSAIARAWVCAVQKVSRKVLSALIPS